MNENLKKITEDNKIIEVIAGSNLYGTNTPESDKDYVGIFMPPEKYIFGLSNIEQIDLSIKDKNEEGKNTKDAIDKKFYEFRKFIRLAHKSNPNILELLFVNEKNILSINDIGRELLSRRHSFISQLCIDSFMGYAIAQKKKMIIKTDHFNELTEAYKILCLEEDKLTLGQLYDKQQEWSLSVLEPSVFKKKNNAIHIHIGDKCFEPGLYVKRIRRKIKERLNSVTNRKELILKHGYDTKFGSHLIRLLYEGLHILRYGEIVFPLEEAPQILDIKTGKYKLNEVLELSKELENQFRLAAKTTKIPATPDFKTIEKFTIDSMKKHLLT